MTANMKELMKLVTRQSETLVLVVDDNECGLLNPSQTYGGENYNLWKPKPGS